MSFLALGLCSLFLSSPQAATVRGRVVDARTQAPVRDARVVLTALDATGQPVDATVRTTQADADGRFEFAAVSLGSHIIAVTTVGYLFVRRQVEVDAAAPLDIVVPLAEGAGTYEEHVTVTTGVESDPGVGTRTLGPAALQDLRGVVTDDPMRAVQSLPGVATGDDFQAGFSVRGSPFRHTGVTIDGVPAAGLLHVVRAEANSGSVSMISTDVLSGAALIVGARPARDGDWLGPTLVLALREGSRDRSAGRVALSGTSASMTMEGPIGTTRRGAWLISLRKSYLDWLVRKVESDFQSTIGFWDGHLKAVFDLSERHSIDVVLIGGDAAYREGKTSSANSVMRARSGSTLAAIRWQHRASRLTQNHRVFFLGTEFHNTGDRDQELARGYTQDVGWRGEVTMQSDGAWFVAAGGALEHGRAGQLARRFHFDAAEALVEDRYRSLPFSASTTGAWLEGRRVAERGNITIGIRGTRRSDIDGSSWSPWITADRRVGQLTFRAAAGGTTQFPDPLTVTDPRPVDSERAGSFDVGMSHEVSPRRTWSVDAFARREWNVLRSADDRVDPFTSERVFAPAFPVALSTLEGRTRGVDVVVRRLAPARLAGWVGYTWSRARMRDRVTGEQFDADFDQRHTLNVVVSERLSYRSAIGMKLRVGSNTPLIGYFEPTPEGLRLSPDRNRVRLPTYARLDARATRTFTFARRRLTLFVEVMNVLNRQNVGPADPSIRASLQVTGFAERLIPRVPSAGFVVEF